MDALSKIIDSKGEKLIHFIEKMEDERANGLYELLKSEIEDESSFVLSDELKAELDQIDDDLDNGRMHKFTTQKQFRKFVKEKINRE